MNSHRWVNTIAFLAMVTVNALANIIPIGGNKTADVSKAYPNLFTPAPTTFAIWGIIYAFLLLFIVFQLGILMNDASAKVVREKIGWSFVISCALNIGWIFAWHLRMIELSTLLIVLLLVSLIVITKRLYVSPTSLFNFLMVKMGFDIYYGWIIVATIANISVMLVKLNWNRFGLSELTWTLIVLCIGSLIGSLVVFKDGRIFSGAAIIWAYIGIVIKHVSAKGYDGRYPSIVIVAAIGILIIFTTILYRIFCPKAKVGICSTLD